jgi:hypothetical protein
MLSSFKDLKEVVNEALKRIGKHDLVLLETDWDLIEELCDFLTSFKELTDLVSGNSCGLSLMPLIIEEIEREVKPKAKDSAILKNLKACISPNIQHRFPISNAVKLCTLLDPSTKTVLELSEEDMQICLKEALEVEELCNTADTTASDSGKSEI